MSNKDIEDIKQFKRELQSYKNHKANIKRLKEKLLEIDTKLENVKSPKFEAVPVHTLNINGDMRLHLIEEKEKVNKRIAIYQSIIADIDERLNKLTKEESDILKLVYVENVSIGKIARTYYKSESTMYRDINKMIAKTF